MKLFALACVLAGCSSPYGAYVEITSPPFDHLQLYFGGTLSSCTAERPIQTLIATDGWTNTNPDRTRDRMFRLQKITPSSITASSTSDTYYIPPLADVEPVGQIVIVVASKGSAVVGVGEVDNFTPSTNDVDIYQVALAPVTDTEFQFWGPQNECVRWTHNDATNLPASTFIVDDDDRDCDGITTDACANPPVLNDCDPMRWCGAAAAGSSPTTDGCTDGSCTVVGMTVGECLTGSPSSGACTNTPGIDAATCTPAPAEPACLAGVSCNTAVCDRAPLDCVAVNTATADLNCSIPTTTAGLICTTSGIVVPLTSGTTPCGLILATATTNPERQNGVSIGFGPLDGASPCSLAIGPVPVTATVYAPPGTLSHTRMLVEVYESGSVGGSLVIDIKPVPGDCTPMPTCTPVDMTLPTTTCTR